jgi:Uma2 family endonuclease
MIETEQQTVAVAPRTVTFEEYLASPIEGRLEWVGGECVEMTPANLEHEEIFHFLAHLLRDFIGRFDLGWLYGSNTAMRLPAGASRVPDLLFVAKANVDRLLPTFIDGPADLVVEIVSPESDVRDRGDKFLEYEEARIPEYWLVDLIRRDSIFFVLGEDGRYHPRPLDAEGWYHSVVLDGFRIKESWLWQRPLPQPFELIAETRRAG